MSVEVPGRIIRLTICALALVWAVAVSPQVPAGAVVTPGAAPLPRIRFAAGEGSTILVHGTYPKVPSPCRQPVQPLLHARYPGTIEVGLDTDGSLFVIAEVPFEQYVDGLGEMPRTWPIEALKAQAVAARTYALAHLASPDETARRLGYQLCATSACQVYLGEQVAGGPYGARWRKAVSETDGQVLLYRGRPADTLYFSTSNGQTFGNDQIFSTAPLPYLRPVAENDDGASPLSHWSTSIPFADIGRFLGSAGAWPTGIAVSSVALQESTVTVKGGGVTRTLPVVDFRTDLNAWAHCLDPDHYPTGSLPQTVPSRWFSLSTDHKTVVLDGRGWGHGVGMVQWGAYGKAVRGLSYADILTAYYGGLEPRAYDEPPTIRVGVATGLRSVVVDPDGPVSITGRDLRGGPWVLTGGSRINVSRAKRPPVYIHAGTLKGPKSGSSGQTRHATVDLPQTSVVHLVLRANRQDTDVTPVRTLDGGSTRLAWTVPEIVSGTYSLQAVVTDGVDVVRTHGVPIRIAGLAAPTPTLTPTPSPSPVVSVTPPAPSPSPAGHGTDVGLYFLIGSIALALGIAALSVLFLYRRLGGGPPRPAPFEPHQGPPS